MDEKQFNKKLENLKRDYDHLPEFRTDEEIARGVFQQTKNTKIRWIQRISYAAAVVVAIAVFAILSVSQLENNPNADDEIEQPTDEEYQSWDLEQKYEYRLQLFQESLGIQDVSNIHEVEQAQSLVERFKNSENEEELEDVVRSINNLLTTPAMKMESINHSSSSEIVYFQVSDLIGNLKNRQMSMQEHWNRVIDDHDLSEEEIAGYVSQYENRGSIVGPKRLQETLTMIENQGYDIKFEDNPLGNVKINYHWINENLNEELATAEIKGYVNILVMDNRVSQPQAILEELTELILAVEEQYRKYDQESEYYLQELSEYATTYLNEFLYGEVAVGERIPEKIRGQINDFTEEHDNSLFTPLVEKVLSNYKENDWIRTEEQLLQELVASILGDRKAYNAVYKQVLLPLNEQLQTVYDTYSQTHDDELLRGLNPFQVMQLYMLASENNDFETYYALLMKEEMYYVPDKESLRNDSQSSESSFFWNLAGETAFTLQEMINNDEQRIVLWFNRANIDEEHLLAFQVVQRDDGIWKVPFMPMQ